MADKHLKRKLVNRLQKSAKLEREKNRLARAKETIEHLKKQGCKFPFYEGFDSFKKWLDREMVSLKEAFSCLHEIRLLEYSDFSKGNFDRFINPAWKHLSIKVEDSVQYGKNKAATFVGTCPFYLDESDDLKAVIFISYPKSRVIFGDFRYGIMLASLHHEMGHLVDALNKGFLDPQTGRFDVIEGECFANCYALDKLANDAMPSIYELLYDGIQSYSDADNYMRDVAAAVLKQHPRKSLVKWSDWMEGAQSTEG